MAVDSGLGLSHFPACAVPQHLTPTRPHCTRRSTPRCSRGCASPCPRRAQDRVSAIVSVHGDASALAGCLRLTVVYLVIQHRKLVYGDRQCGFNTKHQSTKARLVGGDGDWRGGVTQLLHLGDVTDRGDGARECTDMLPPPAPYRNGTCCDRQPACG